jgi:hypothetical protein
MDVGAMTGKGSCLIKISKEEDSPFGKNFFEC